MKPSDTDVIEAYHWLIDTIDGTMKATGRTKWTYYRGFRADDCGTVDGKPMFQFYWSASAPGLADREKAAKAAAAYLASRGLTGMEAGPFHEGWAAAYRNETTRVFGRVLEGKGGVVEISTACYSGDSFEADQAVQRLTSSGAIKDPKFFKPDA